MEMTTILIVDDSPIDLKMVRAFLDTLDHCVLQEAATGQEALSYVRGHPTLSLLLMDVQLPDICGIEVCRSLKDDPATSHIPVVLISAVDKDEDSIAAGLDAGADGYLTKPMDGTALRAWLKATLRISSLQKALEERNLQPPKDEKVLLQRYSKLSHAVNNPLQSIMAGADLLLLDQENNSEMVFALRDIQQAAERIAELVGQASLDAKEALRAREES